MALVSLKRLYLTNIAIPGYWSHAALVCDGDTVLEAVGRHGVRQVDYRQWMLDKDYVACMNPRWVDGLQKADAVTWGRWRLGEPYDMAFKPGNNAWYCSEYVYHAYAAAMAMAGKPMPFKKRKRLGIMSVTPDDIYLADKKWELVWDSRH
jgi:uncharacterized protein YycO